VAGRVLRVEVDDAELATRRAAWRAPGPRFGRGYGALFSEHVTQANEGCDFEFLSRAGATPDPEPNPQ
jgi:dihydroxyacid dehydratase/phosphogluconate dehydratase